MMQGSPASRSSFTAAAAARAIDRDARCGSSASERSSDRTESLRAPPAAG